MKSKILLAEDDALTRFMMTEILDELDYEFSTCRDGSEAVSTIKRNPDAYDLILMDVHMPHKNGVEAVREIRQAEADPPNGIPIVAITADVHWQNPQRCTAVGFTDVMSKPVSLEELKERLTDWLKR